MFRGFKDFLLRGNVIDLSVAVVIGAAFTAVVTAFTESFLEPLIQLLSPGGDQFRGTLRVDGVVFDYAGFINQAITFFITAAVVYFLVVAPMKALQNRRLRGEESGPARPTDIELLAQIRDLLEAQAQDRGLSVPDDGRGPAADLAARLDPSDPAGPSLQADQPSPPDRPGPPPAGPAAVRAVAGDRRGGFDAGTVPVHPRSRPGRPTPPWPAPPPPTHPSDRTRAAEAPPRHARAGTR